MKKYLQHHGIKGQKWGVKNGPPYPLDSGTHNRIVRKDKAKTGGLAAVLAYSAVALYTIAEYTGLIEKGKTKIADKLDPPVSRSYEDFKRIRKKGKSYEEIDDTLISTINGKHHYDLTNGGKVNCLTCSLAYISDTVAYEKDGKIYGAKGGYFAQHTGSEADESVGINSVLKNAKAVYPIDRDNTLSFEEASQKIKKNTSGMLFINGDNIFTYGGHAINYECDSKGNITIIDCQEGKKYTYENFQKKAGTYNMNNICAIYDCSNAVLNNESDFLEKIFK